MKECSIDDTCVFCAHFSPELWHRISEAKRKRLAFRARAEQSRTARIMAETAHTSQTYVEGEDTVLEAGEIAHNESETERRSDSDIPYGREEMVDSENDHESGSEEHHVSHLANLTQGDRRLSGSGEPVISPDEIEMPELIRWIGTNSLFELCTPSSPNVDPGQYAMLSQYVPPKREDEFLTLSTSPAILNMAERRVLEARDKEKDSGVTVGRIPPSPFCKVPMRQYHLGDEGLNLVAPAWPSELPKFLVEMLPQTRLRISDAHAAKMDGALREALAIISRVDACACAINERMPHPGDLNDSYLIRTIRALGSGIGDVAKLLVLVSHQLTLHRRDTALWEARARGLSAKDILAIRHAPSMGTESIVDTELLAQIGEKKLADAQKKAIMRVATASSVIQVQHQQKAATPAKRSLQLPKKEEPSSKRRKQVSPRKASTHATATQQAAATPPSKQKSHR